MLLEFYCLKRKLTSFKTVYNILRNIYIYFFIINLFCNHRNQCTSEIKSLLWVDILNLPGISEPEVQNVLKN